MGFIAGNSAKVKRWDEPHLNFDTQPTSSFFFFATEFHLAPTYAVPCGPSSEEVAYAIRKLRNNKAPGEGGIRIEVYKSCADTQAP
nr:unnamed protein product [Spirometra erinaceieuropaei]